ncbi:5618_t:CDS:2, partial [Dentiscutata heterogama]
CYDRFEKPHKKLDGALAIPYDLKNIKSFGNIEKEILSRSLPEHWGKIKLGQICYQISNTTKADHYDLKSDGAITAFISEVKYKKNLQLCIYQENNESIRASKRVRTLEMESDAINTLNNIKKKIYKNLPSCEIHIQGVDEKTPPNIPSFDKNKYQYPISKQFSNE